MALNQASLEKNSILLLIGILIVAAIGGLFELDFSTTHLGVGIVVDQTRLGDELAGVEDEQAAARGSRRGSKRSVTRSPMRVEATSNSTPSTVIVESRCTLRVAW